MQKEGKRSLLASGAVIAVALAAAGGFYARRVVDVGPDADAAPKLLRPGILASADDTPVELSESEYFYQLMQLIVRNYVDPITDEIKLASGAVRGMVSSLVDPHSMPMTVAQFKAHQNRLTGRYEGIGVELDFKFDDAELKKLQSKNGQVDGLLLIPDLLVASVITGSPADQAGLRPGDRITSVNGKYIVSSRDVKKLREMQTQVNDKKMTPAEFEIKRREFVEKADNAIPVSRARELLTTGIDGQVKLEFARGTTSSEANLGKRAMVLEALKKNEDGSYSLHVLKGAAKELKAVISGSQPIVLDLRNSGSGNFNEIKELLEVLGPAGEYGSLQSERPGNSLKITTKAGPTTPVPLTFIVDKSTRGAAEILALALSGRGYAKLRGSEMSGTRLWINTYSLPDGSGYTLATGIFRPNLKKGGA